MRRRVRTLVVLLLVLTGLPVVAGAQTSAERSQLQQARDRIERISREIDAAAASAEDARLSLEEADRRLAEVEVAVNEAASALERQETAVRRSGAELDRLAAEADALEAAFDRRAARLYKSGTSLSLEVVLAAGDLDAAIQRSSYVQVITAADRASLEQVHNARVAVEAQRGRYDAERARLEEMHAEQTALLADVAELRASRALAAARARDELEQLEASRDDLEGDVERIERLIAERKVTPVSASMPSTAGYIWPRCDRVTSEYGRRWGRLHAGLDIDGDPGQPIGASKAGVVIFAGWQGGYGQLTLIDHGDGVVTAYAHQSRILVESGQRVDRGERIGDVGNTGRSTGPHLHFETRVNGSAVDPRRFMPDGC